MTVTKITNAPTQNATISKINEIIDNLGGGGGGSVDIDNLTITKNTSDEIQTVAVIDNNTTNALKTWTGTRAQYEALVSGGTVDSNTLYNITDDTDVTLSLLELLYPVGSLYIASGTLSTCPLYVLGVGTWSLKAITALVTDVNSIAPVVGNGMTLGLADGTKNSGLYASSSTSTGLVGVTQMYGTNIGGIVPSGATIISAKAVGVTSDPDKSGIQANITSTTLSVTIWERIS